MDRQVPGKNNTESALTDKILERTSPRDLKRHGVVRVVMWGGMLVSLRALEGKRRDGNESLGEETGDVFFDEKRGATQPGEIPARMA